MQKWWEMLLKPALRFFGSIGRKIQGLESMFKDIAVSPERGSKRSTRSRKTGFFLLLIDSAIKIADKILHDNSYYKSYLHNAPRRESFDLQRAIFSTLIAIS